MTRPLPVIDMPSAGAFVQDYIAQNRPVVVRGLQYEPRRWTPESLRETLGDMNALVYGALFDLEDVQPVEDYLDDWFGLDGPIDDDVPYIRWYNKLRDVDFAWGDEAFRRLAHAWRTPRCMPADNLLVPLSKHASSVDPVTDPFPYRGVLIAARGARTRLHRDPFCSDAVVCQFHGAKQAALYRPDRTAELTDHQGTSSFGGFIDVREHDIDKLSVEPDYLGRISPGEMIYIPNGWLHDVVVTEDSASVTWNFVHRLGAANFLDRYLSDDPEADTEFEILQYFHALAGLPGMLADAMLVEHSAALVPASVTEEDGVRRP